VYAGTPNFPKWGDDDTMPLFNVTDFGAAIKAPAANSRCAWWQKGLYY
jgi:hypothetical protein